ncbi:ammonium transporter [Lactobacillus kalixensis]|uniref:Ammonium transporter n=1 Tax=Lactobacillus kalixensis DSM 16043 TaxID=1423763 RepID=A0A0R1UIF2_9LACO|nr:ammonium transporter [Lactobacillus kalixensis]KRL89099.1 ammonium transporter [Lactobacillus kalixensis DSM 16043]
MINQSNTLFVFISSVLVFFMTPGLAFFYGGMVSKKNAVNTMISVFMITGLAIVLFIAFGYNLAFGKDVGGVFGLSKSFFLNGFDLKRIYSKDTGITLLTYLMFQMMFSIITPALFVGATVGRMKFKFLLVFVVIWSILIYYPMVHMVWTPNGILAKTGMLDFAGGTVIHVNAGITALFLSIFVGPRIDFNPEDEVKHYNLAWVLMGTSILWIGWYGFNVGSALTVSDIATQAFLTTTVATGTSFVVWMFLDIFIQEKTNMIGLCTGALCGLVGITPAAGYVTVAGAFAIGFICTLASYIFIHVIKPKLKLDDPLDAFGCHGVSGIMGSVLTGLFATKIVNPQVENGLFYGGGSHLLIVQVGGTLLTIIFVGIMTTIIVLSLQKVIPIRVSKEEELIGLDLAEHGEQADYGMEFEKTEL